MGFLNPELRSVEREVAETFGVPIGMSLTDAYRIILAEHAEVVAERDRLRAAVEDLRHQVVALLADD